MLQSQVDLLVVNGCDEFRLARLLLEIFTKLNDHDLLGPPRPQADWGLVAHVIWVRGMFATSVLEPGSRAMRQCKMGPRGGSEWASEQSAESLYKAAVHFLELHGYQLHKATVTELVFTLKTAPAAKVYVKYVVTVFTLICWEVIELYKYFWICIPRHFVLKM